MATDDKLLWMTKNPNTAAQVGANIVDRALRWDLERPPCMVFDVDETLILNNPNDDDTFKVQQVGKTLFDYGAARNIPIFIVTARAKSKWAVNYLMKQLRKAGYDTSNIKGAYLQPRTYVDKGDGGAAFKKMARDKIGADYTIVLNAGDRWGDHISHDNSTDKGTIAVNVPTTKDTYVGIAPRERHIVYGLKFPEEV